MSKVRFFKFVRMALLIPAAILCLPAQSAWANPTAQFAGPLTITSVSTVDNGGQVIQIAVSGGTVPGCSSTAAYAVRDANIINGALALATSALVSNQQITVWVSGSCDTDTGLPLVTVVQLN